MRELKFRLVNDGKIVGYEKHMLQTEIVDEDDWPYIFIAHAQVEPLYYPVNLVKSLGTDTYFIEHDIKDQYTGLKDTNGKEIYEGDIILCVRKGELIPYKVYKDEETQQHWIDSLDGAGDVEQLYGFHHTCKIIGNIYENPELLNPSPSLDSHSKSPTPQV
jgi:hypothetical protein